MKQATLPFYTKLACMLISLLCIGYLVFIAKEILEPLVFSFLFAMLLLPVARFLQYKLRLPRGAAAMMAVILFTAFMVSIAYIIGLQLSSIYSDWPKIQAQVQQTYDQIHRWAYHEFHIGLNQQLNTIKTEVNASAASYVSSTVLSVSSIFLFLVLIFIYTFFILFYRKILISFLLKAFGDGSDVMVFDIAGQIQYIMRKYISGLFIEMLIVCGVVYGVLSLLGVQYAFLLALITAVFNLVPYVGIFSAMAIGALLTLGTAGSTKALEVAASIVGMHLVDSNILMPRIVGSKVKLNALIVVLGVVIGEMLWGISGMFLSIPVLAIVKIIFDRVDDLKPWGLLLGDETDYADALVEEVVEKGDSVEEIEDKVDNDEI
ncbi:AI-2E family transporter [uncultured Mucilaginibacter sp.]|uniref:AI-2E family transporter n=1 Tax=uncultured Mucilaginibacter sp. TaxID=797541 RepID=UPI0025F64E49|nr:AI-2E family transporter [uncultured Mucilaginibacter sp.]